MSIGKKALGTIEKTSIGRQLVRDRGYRSITFAVFSLIFNLIYAFYNGALGIISQSSWFGASCVYYLILCAVRSSAVIFGVKMRRGHFVMFLSGVLLSLLSIVLAVINYISMSENTAKVYGTITMITIAAYTFTKLTAAIVKASRHRRDRAPLMVTIRNIGYAETAVSILTLQRSMLVSFPGMTAVEIMIFNMCTGGAVCFFTLSLGIVLIKNSIKRGGENGRLKA